MHTYTYLWTPGPQLKKMKQVASPGRAFHWQYFGSYCVLLSRNTTKWSTLMYGSALWHGGEGGAAPRRVLINQEGSIVDRLLPLIPPVSNECGDSFPDVRNGWAINRCLSLVFIAWLRLKIRAEILPIKCSPRRCDLLHLLYLGPGFSEICIYIYKMFFWLINKKLMTGDNCFGRRLTLQAGSSCDDHITRERPVWTGLILYVSRFKVLKCMCNSNLGMTWNFLPIWEMVLPISEPVRWKCKPFTFNSSAQLHEFLTYQSFITIFLLNSVQKWSNAPMIVTCVAIK